MNINQLLERLQAVKPSGERRWMAKCPAHEDASPSLSISEGREGIVLKCFAGCTFEQITAALGIEARELFFKQNGAHQSAPAARAKTGFDWQGCLDGFTSADADRLAKWRGIPVEFWNWLNAQGLLGVCDGKPAFAVRDESGAVSCCHSPAGDGRWKYFPTGQGTHPLTFGDVAKSGFVLAFESQWDAFAVMEKLSWHKSEGLPDTAVFITRGASNGKRIAGRVSRDAVVFAFTQNDDPGRKWIAELASNAGCRVVNVATPDPHKDANDWARAGATETAIRAAMNAAKAVEVPLPADALTIRTPDELLAMKFDDSDRILGDSLLRRGSSLALAGPGSIGKSRLALQLAVACRAGLPFIGFETHGRTDLRWLILQAENSNRRLQADLLKLRAWIGPKQWPRVEAGLHIHCLEADQDGFLSLDSPKTELRLRDVITRLRPDVIVWDSLYNFAAGDLNSDEAMAGTLLSISRLSKTGDALRAIVLLHHALTGKAGAAKATGWDRTSYGRNSKVLHQWTRAQINLAPGKPDASDVVVCSCGKLNDGQPFAPFAYRLDPDSMIYAPDPDFDLSGWQSEVTGKKAEPLMSVARVAELCAGSVSKSDLADAVKEDCGCARSTAFEWVKRADRARAIYWTKATEKYVRKP